MARRHLLGTHDLGAEEALAIIERARALRPFAGEGEPVRRELAGRTIANVFFEPSTRTRTSFRLAARRLGAEVVDYDVSTGSTVKGETTVDTVRNLVAMGLSAVVVRSAYAGTAQRLAQRVDACVLNAGDGAHEHPTQALLDLLTLLDAFGSVAGRHIAIVGDIGTSRVARSNLFLLPKLGAKVTLCGPPQLVPRSLAALGGTIAYELDPLLPEVDAVMLLRTQHERHQAGAMPSLREHAALYGLSAERAARLPKHAIVMHPGPIHRGAELAPEVADGDRSAILHQTRNGVAVRMAVLSMCVEASERGLR